MMQQVFEILAWGLLLLSLPGTLYLALLTLAAAMPQPQQRRQLTDKSMLRAALAIVVPAHNEAEGIAACLANLLAVARADGNTQVVVVADNCSDATAAIATSAGARVLLRQDAEKRGKGYALDYAFNALAEENFAAYIVVDADSRVSDNFIRVMRRHFSRGAMVVQSRYGVLNADVSARTRLAQIALACFNLLRLRGRAALGISVGILGNGFALRRELLQRVPYRAASVVEDLEYHLELVAASYRVEFAAACEVRGEMPSGEQGNRSQRMRWEGGRLRMLGEHGVRLLLQVACGQWRSLDPLAELLLVPLAYQVSLLLLALLAAAWTLLTPVAIAVCLSLLVVAAHVLLAMRLAGLPWRQLDVLTTVPAYLLWKLRMLPLTVLNAARSSAWVRTHRDGS